MNQKKKISKKSIIIISILVVIILALAGFAFAYFTTDILKNEKQCFVSYFAKMFDAKNGFIENNLISYFEKQQNTPYKDDGNISADINVPEAYSEEINKVKDTNITFTGEVDKPNSKATQDISINYSDNVTFPFSYRRDGDIYGLKTEYVGSKYVTIDSTRLDDLGLGELQQDANEAKETSSIISSKDDIDYLKETYIPVLNQNLQESKFSKVSDGNRTGYKLTVTYEDLKNLAVSLLQALKTDQTTLDKLNEDIEKESEKYTADSIENIIKQVNNLKTDDGEISITIYQEKNKPVKLELTIDDTSISADRVAKTNDSVEYNVAIQNGDNKIALDAKYSGLDSMQNVSENYELSVEMPAEVLASENILTASDKARRQMAISTEEETVNLIIGQVKMNKMINNTAATDVEISREDLEEQIQSENYNITIIDNTNGNINLTFEDTGDTFEVDTSGTIVNSPSLSDSQQDTDSSIDENLENETLSYKYTYTNNVVFETGSNIEGYNSDNSLSLNDYNEEERENFLNAVAERLTEVRQSQMEELGLAEGEDPIILLMPFTASLSMYNQASGTAQDNNMEAVAITQFNTMYENYEGTNLQAQTVRGLLSTMQTMNQSNQQNNSKYLIEEINFDGEELEATDQNIASLKSEMDTTKTYTVSFEKNEDGVINRVVITTN
mgnify:FL=1